MLNFYSFRNPCIFHGYVFIILIRRITTPHVEKVSASFMNGIMRSSIALSYLFICTRS